MMLYEELIAMQDEREAASLPAPHVIYLSRREFDALAEELSDPRCGMATFTTNSPHAKSGDVLLAGQTYGRALA